MKTLGKVSSLLNILGVRRPGEINSEVQVRSLNRRLSVAGAFFKLLLDVETINHTFVSS